MARKKIASLRAHPLNAEIYAGDAEANKVDDLAESIKEVGLLHPIVITKTNLIISGHRRVAALKRLKKTYVDCVIRDIPPDQELYFLINGNKQRQKNMLQMVNEIGALQEIYKTKKFKDEDDASPKASKRPPKSARARIAIDLGISTATIHYLQTIKRLMPEILTDIGQSITLRAAYMQCKANDNQAKIEAGSASAKASEVVNIYGTTYMIFNKSSKNMEELHDESINIAIGSPPYWKQRAYTDDPDELGQETRLQDYIGNLLDICDEIYRVLDPTGCLYLNIGDRMRGKSRLQIPERVSIELIDRRPRWYLKSQIIWNKGNSAKPEGGSVRRWQNSYEKVFFLTKDPENYFFDADLIREAYSTDRIINPPPTRHASKKAPPEWAKDKFSGDEGHIRNPKGRIAKDVLSISRADHSDHLTIRDIDHPAIWPVELVDTLLAPVIEPGFQVLDPFAGSSSTAEAVAHYGAYFLGYEINPAFCRLSEQRLKALYQE